MLHFVLRVAEQPGDLGSILRGQFVRSAGAIEECLDLPLGHLLEHILAVGSCVRTALVEKLGGVDEELLKCFLTELALRFLDLLVREGVFEQTLDGQGVPVRSLKQQLAAGIGRPDQVVGQHLFLGRQLGPDHATGDSTLHADGFRQRQRLYVSSLTEDVGNTSENERECQKH